MAGSKSKTGFLEGLRENLRATAEFRKNSGRLSRFFDASVVTVVYTFKFLGKKITSIWKSNPYSPLLLSMAAWGALILCCVLFFANYSFGVKVTLGKVELIVDDQKTFNEVLDKVEDEYTKKTGENFYFESQPVYSLTVSNAAAFASNDEIYDSLSNEAEISMGMSYGVFVDGALVGTYPRETDLWELFDRIKARYSAPGAKDEVITIDNDISFVRGMYAKNKSKTLEELYDVFTQPADSRTVTVVKGDKASALAAEYGLTLTQLKLLNPDYDFSSLKAGTKLFVSKPEVPLRFVIERTEVYTKNVAYKTVTTYDKNMFETQSVVTKQGSDGITEYTDKVMLIDGEEISRETLSTSVIKKVVNKAVTKGTKSLAPTGSFIWPIQKGSYKITSYFMDKDYYRVFRSWHKGLDLGARYGTPILAADSGTVVFAGWTSAKGFGYLVKVEHQKGVVTYYGHCSKVAVRTGDKVYKGQTIAYVGSTGNSTGNHLHFQIMVNNEAVNPLKYLK